MFSFITRPIGCLFSLVGSIVVIALVLVLLGLWLLSYFMPQIGAKAISEATGFPTSIGDAGFSLWSQKLELNNLRIDNPETYPEDDFLAVSHWSLRLDRKASDREHLVFSDVTLHIDTLTLVRLSGTVLNGSALVRNLLENKVLSPQRASAATRGAEAVEPFPQRQPQSAAVPQGGQGGAVPQGAQRQQGQGNGTAPMVYFEPIVPLEPIEIPPLTASATQVVDSPQAERPRWLIRSLNIRIDSVRLFESSPQGNFLQLVPLQYQRTFSGVSSLQEVLPAILQDLARRGIPL